MFSWRFKVSDDRGRRVPAFNWRRLDRFRRDLDPGMLCARRTDPDLIEAELSTRMWPLAVLIVAAVATMLFTFGTLWFVVPIVAVAFGAPTYWRFSSLRLLVKTMQGEGYCPSCAYALKDVPAEPDGCQLCPECGAAWQRSTAIAPDAMVKDTEHAAPQVLRPGIIADHRGKPVRECHRRTGLEVPRSPKSRAFVAKEALIDAVFRLSMTTRGIITVALAFTFLVCLSLAINRSLLVGGTLCVMVVLVAVSLLPGLFSNRSSKVAVALLDARQCASCGYDLADISIEADGCRTCPECGAAWRLDSSAPTDAPS